MAIFLILIALNLAAVHNFTVNGSDNVLVSIGETLEFRFEYETVGSVATVAIQVNLSTFDFPEIHPENACLIDGGVLDETGEDGIFLYHFDNFVEFPSTSSLVLILTDYTVSDSVTIGFEPLESDFSISGQILKEGTHINTPVRGAFVYSFYNANKDEINDLFENPTSEDFFDYMQEDRYFLSVLSNNSGEYSVNLPDDFPDVPCTIDVYSTVDVNNEKVSPSTLDLTVNGNETGIDLLYRNPDGDFIGHVENTVGDSLPNAWIMVTNSDTTNTIFTFSDSLGNFEIPLLNDDYSYKIMKTGYEDLVGSFSMNDADYEQTLVLSDLITHLDAPQNIGFHIENDSLFISWNPVQNAEFYNIYSSDDATKSLLLWATEATEITTTEWSRALNGEMKKFFYIKAIRN